MNKNGKKDLILRSSNPNTHRSAEIRDKGVYQRSDFEYQSNNLNQVKKDLILKETVLPEKKKSGNTWSLEALGLTSSEVQQNEEVEQIKSPKKKKKNKSRTKMLGSVKQEVNPIAEIELEAERQEEAKKVPLYKTVINCIIIPLVAIFAIVFIYMTKTGTNFVTVECKEMYPTLDQGQFVITKNIRDYSTIDYFDIVALDFSNGKVFLRVLGKPGDRIYVRKDSLFINENAVSAESVGGSLDFQDMIYNGPENYKFNDGEDYLYYEIPEGCYFLLGDNHSSGLRDSISCGPIDGVYLTEELKK